MSLDVDEARKELIELVPLQTGKPIELCSKLALLRRKEEFPLPELVVERRAERRG